MASKPSARRRGPFTADQIRSGDPYEISEGYVLECLPTGGRGARASHVGASVLGSDPDVEEVGIDTGYSPHAASLRAPDLAVGNVPDEPGWVAGAPPLAVEYADRGQDEPGLAVKIRELLAAGTRHVWVVRLDGPRRVEVHEPGKEVRLARGDDLLEAPGILRNAIPVEALYDRRVGQQVTLRNLLQREGYDSLDAVRVEGVVEGEIVALREAILAVLAARGVPVTGEARAAVESSADRATLLTWLRRAATATSAESLLDEAG